MTRTHMALSAAEAQFRKRDGPLPTSVASCVALFLSVRGLVNDETLRAALPRAAPLLLEKLGGAAEGGLAADVNAAQVALSDMRASVEAACALELACCHHHEEL